MPVLEMGITEAKRDFNKVVAQVEQTGVSVTIYKHNRPCVVIEPARRVGVRRRIVTAQELFKDYDGGRLQEEDPWADAGEVGAEVGAWS